MVAFCDVGYDHKVKKPRKKTKKKKDMTAAERTKKKNDEIKDPTTIRKFCKDVGAIFVCPPKTTSLDYAEVGDDGLIRIVQGDPDTTFGLKSLQDNYRTFVGFFRHPVEQVGRV